MVTNTEAADLIEKKQAWALQHWSVMAESDRQGKLPS